MSPGPPVGRRLRVTQSPIVIQFKNKTDAVRLQLLSGRVDTWRSMPMQMIPGSNPAVVTVLTCTFLANFSCFPLQTAIAYSSFIANLPIPVTNYY